MAETVAAIVAAHRAGTSTPEQTVARSYACIRAHGDAAVFISLHPEAEALAEARALKDKVVPESAALQDFDNRLIQQNKWQLRRGKGRGMPFFELHTIEQNSL